MGWIRRFLRSLLAIKLDETSRLVRMGRDFYRYEEGGRSITMQIDMLSGKPDLVIYMASMTGLHSPEVVVNVLDNAEQRRIAEKIAAYFRARGHSVEIE
jgi:hypothetical protein